jgi:hypothetical protein
VFSVIWRLHALRVFRKRLLRRIFGLKEEKKSEDGKYYK